MNCEYCSNDHDGSYGSGRFCSSKCSKGFSTKSKRSEINEIVKSKLTGRNLSEDTKEKIRKNWKRSIWNDRLPSSIEDICVEDSKFARQYIKRRLISEGLKKNICEECGIDSYNDKPLTMQLHHKNGKNKDNRLENLQILCPNCHSQTENYAGKNRSIRVCSSTGTEH